MHKFLKTEKVRLPQIKDRLKSVKASLEEGQMVD